MLKKVLTDSLHVIRAKVDYICENLMNNIKHSIKKWFNSDFIELEQAENKIKYTGC